MTTSAELRRDEKPEAARPDHARWWTVAAGLSTALTFVLYLIIARTAVAPRTPWDENAIFQMARVINGEDVTPMLGSGYNPGWAFAIAPVYWFTDDPSTAYRAAIWIVIVLAMSLIWPMALIGRELGLTRAQAVTVAALVAILPARSGEVDYALSETFLTFWLLWAVVAMFRWWRRPTVGALLGLTVSAGMAYLTHPRALALVATVAIWLLMVAVRGRRVHAAAGLAVLAVGYWLVGRAVTAISEPTLVTGFGKEERLLKSIENSSAELVAKIVLSQTFAQLLATFSLLALAVVIVAPLAWRELRRWRPGPYLFVAGLVTSTMLVSFAWWSSTEFLAPDPLTGRAPRFDVWLYTRYIDPVMAVVCVIALAALIRGVTLRQLASAAGVCLAVCVPVVLWVAPTVPLWGSRLGPGNIAGVLHWSRFWDTGEPFDTPLTPTLTNDNQFWLLASIFTVLTLVFLAAVRSMPRVITVAALGVFTVAALAANPSQSRDAPERLLAGVESVEAVTPGDEPARVEIDMTCESPNASKSLVVNWTGMWMAPRRVVLKTPAYGETFEEPLVFSCDTADGRPSETLDPASRKVDGASSYGYALWVRPGELQDRLDEAGLLAPTP